MPSLVVGVAHKVSKVSPLPGPQPASGNKFDQDLEAEPMRSLTSMTPSQRSILEKTDPDSFQKYQKSVPNPFKEQLPTEEQPRTAAHKSPAHGEPVVWEQNWENKSQQQNTNPIEAKKGQSLMDSVHARSATGRLHSKAPYNPQSQQRLPVIRQTSSPVRMEVGEKHDPMQCFDKKRKEHYPPTLNNEQNAMLQSKDPSKLIS